LLCIGIVFLDKKKHCEEMAGMLIMIYAQVVIIEMSRLIIVEDKYENRKTGG